MKTLKTKKEFQQVFTIGATRRYDWMTVHFFCPRFLKTAMGLLPAGA